jgi:hypothetical protein
MHFGGRIAVAFIACLLEFHGATAAPIGIPETPNDTADLLITNYKWVNSNDIFVCEPNVACNQNTAGFSDIISLFNTGNKAEIIFFSDLESLIKGTPRATDTFQNEPTFSIPFPATDPAGVVRNLTLTISSDVEPSPPGSLSDSIDVTAPAGAPVPNVQAVPEPTTLLLLGPALLLGSWWRKKINSPSV